MNNQQNGSTFGISNQSAMPLSNTPEMNIPGANLVPIGPENVMPIQESISGTKTINSVSIGNDVATMPIPGIVTESRVANTDNSPLVVGVTGNPIIPGIVNSSNQEVPGVVNSNFNQTSNSFVDGSYMNFQGSNSGNVQQINNSSIPIFNNDFGDATPLTNESFDGNLSNINDIISVRMYLLFSIPVLGFIILLVKSLIGKNKNIRNMAIAHFILLVLVSIVLVIFWPKLNNIIK